MSTIHIRTQVDSETLYLPQLKYFIGKQVEIVVQEAPSAESVTGDWEAAARAAHELRATDYDFEAWREQREYDLKQSENHLP